MSIKLKKATLELTKDERVLRLSIYSHYLHLYRFNISVCIGDKDTNKYAKFYDVKPVYGLCDNIDEHDEIILYFSDKAITDMACIAHECTHATDYILASIGYRRYNGADECNAYLVGFLFEVVLKAKKKYER